MAQKSLETQEKILQGSLEQMNQRGFSAVTVAEIAERAGISTGNLSYHFPTKRDLVLALWQRSAERHLELLAVDWRAEAVVSQLVEWVGALCEVMWEFRFLYRDRNQYRALVPELRQRTRETLVQRGRELLGECLDTMADAGYMHASVEDRAHLATACWIVLRYWIDYLVEARDLQGFERGQVEELTGELIALIRPWLTRQASAELERAGEATGRHWGGGI